jgi:hypothetical protein
MTYYIKLSTSEYPRHEGDIRLEHPEILESQTGDTFPCPDTYAPVEFVPQPEVTELQTIKLGVPAQDEAGKWKATWIVRDLTPEELEAIAQADAIMNQEFERQNGPMP